MILRFRHGNMTETRPFHGKLDHHVSAGWKRDGYQQRNFPFPSSLQNTEIRYFVLWTTTTNYRVSFVDLYSVLPRNFRIVFLPHTNTVILLEPYCGTITEPGLPVVDHDYWARGRKEDYSL